MPKQVAPNCADSSAPASSTFTRLNSRIGLSAFAMAANAYRSPARMCETGLQTNEDLLTPLIETTLSKIFMRTPIPHSSSQEERDCGAKAVRRTHWRLAGTPDINSAVQCPRKRVTHPTSASGSTIPTVRRSLNPYILNNGKGTKDA